MVREHFNSVELAGARRAAYNHQNRAGFFLGFRPLLFSFRTGFGWSAARRFYLPTIVQRLVPFAIAAMRYSVTPSWPTCSWPTSNSFADSLGDLRV